jgi:hypothetical protein
MKAKAPLIACTVPNLLLIIMMIISGGFYTDGIFFIAIASVIIFIPSAIDYFHIWYAKRKQQEEPGRAYFLGLLYLFLIQLPTLFSFGMFLAAAGR